MLHKEQQVLTFSLDDNADWAKAMKAHMSENPSADELSGIMAQYFDAVIKKLQDL